MYGRTEIQHHLFDLGGELCIPGHVALGEQHVSWLERRLDGFNDDLPALKDFILPGGGPAAASCHLARTVCRRAERVIQALSREEPIGEFVIPYVNRLSDALFVMARYENAAAGVEDVAAGISDGSTSSDASEMRFSVCSAARISRHSI